MRQSDKKTLAFEYEFSLRIKIGSHKQVNEPILGFFEIAQ